MREAKFWTLEGDRVRCYLCPHHCSIADQKRGICGVRENRSQVLYSMNYGKISSANIDPIEKKPLFHFMPGSNVFSIGSIGCNFRCLHCFVPGTFVVTGKGAHRIEEISGIDQAELLTHSGRLMKVKHVFKHHYSGKVCRVKPRYLPEIVCTPEHNFLASVHPNSDHIEKVEAQKLKKGIFIVIPKKKASRGAGMLNIRSILSDDNVSSFNVHRKIDPNLIGRIMEMKADGFTSKQIGSEISLHPAYIRRLFCKIKHDGADSLFRKMECKLVEGDGVLDLRMGAIAFLPN